MMSRVAITHLPPFAPPSPQPDAQARFMEVKVAYETLSDAKQRTEYDRRLRMVRQGAVQGAVSYRVSYLPLVHGVHQRGVR